MELKKNPKADLNKKRTVFFQLALVSLLLLAWFVIENTGSYTTLSIAPPSEKMLFLEEEWMPVALPEKKLPAAPLPEIIDKVIPSKEETKNVDLKLELEPETAASDSHLKAKDIIFIDDPEPVTQNVLVKFVEEVPIFPGCEKELDNKGRLECMSQKINEFINKKFDKDLGSKLGLSGVNTIYVSFKIDTDGEVVGVKTQSRNPRLKKEAERVVNSLPVMTPGKQHGKPVGVLYSLPIIFEIK
ncbi:MAG TPA: energy transducer TonB [Salinimicrobium sp.]|nr:energy transducer TonB [Salinimicrobium sp.]